MEHLICPVPPDQTNRDYVSVTVSCVFIRGTDGEKEVEEEGGNGFILFITHNLHELHISTKHSLRVCVYVCTCVSCGSVGATPYNYVCSEGSVLGTSC